LITQCAQLDEANRAWQQFHQTQLENFREKLRNSFPIDNSVSFDNIAQQMVVHLDQVQNERESLVQQLQNYEKLNKDLRTGSRLFIISKANFTSLVFLKNQ
jgi:predicted PurR-regulated permease PerM